MADERGGDSVAPVAAVSPGSPVWQWARWTLPVHAALPLALGAVGQRWGLELAGFLVIGLHALTAAALVAGLPWWWRRFADVVLLILANHLATAIGGVVVANLI